MMICGGGEVGWMMMCGEELYNNMNVVMGTVVRVVMMSVAMVVAGARWSVGGSGALEVKG